MRTLLVYGERTFQITVPDDAKITFGPWSPPKSSERDYGTQRRDGTLRVYEGANVIAVFSGVSGYRDLSLNYREQVAKEEGATVWKSDERGYEREEKRSGSKEWVDDPVQARIKASSTSPKPTKKSATTSRKRVERDLDDTPF